MFLFYRVACGRDEFSGGGLHALFTHLTPAFPIAAARDLRKDGSGRHSRLLVVDFLPLHAFVWGIFVRLRAGAHNSSS